MALGTFTLVAGGGASPSEPTFIDSLSFAADGAYLTGGTTGFLAKYRALTKSARTPIAVFSLDAAYTVSYDSATDKLKVYDVDAGNELAAADQSAITLKVAVIAK